MAIKRLSTPVPTYLMYGNITYDYVMTGDDKPLLSEITSGPLSCDAEGH